MARMARHLFHSCHGMNSFLLAASLFGVLANVAEGLAEDGKECLSSPACWITCPQGMSTAAMHAQVLKGTLSLIEPSISCGDFLYEEGSGLEDDEIEEYRRHLDTPLASLPPQGSGGLGNGAVVEVRDQAQSIEVKIVVRHQVCSQLNLQHLLLLFVVFMHYGNLSIASQCGAHC